MPDFGTIDASTLARVEGMHRGNLYHHLFAVGCMLLAPNAGLIGMRVDVDEDVELYFEGIDMCR